MKRGWQTEYGIVSRERERERENQNCAEPICIFEETFQPGRWAVAS